jgi:DNA-binding MarR family transcriptional regulator
MGSPDALQAALQKWIEAFMRRSMRGFILYSKESGLSMSQLGALFHMYREGTSGVSDLGDDLGITSAAASQMLERLVQQELVVRSEDPHDRRVKQITLTDKGRRVLQESIRARQGWLDDLPRVLSPGEQEQIVAALNILIEKANQLEREPQREY